MASSNQIIHGEGGSDNEWNDPWIVILAFAFEYFPNLELAKKNTTKVANEAANVHEYYAIISFSFFT